LQEAILNPFRRVVPEVSKTVVGQDDVVELLVAAILASGHVLLEGMPGVAKTLLASSVANCIAADFTRVQFTPELTPSDLIGEMAEGPLGRSFKPGPIFTNVFLADEINRATPKTQSAMLEAMQERQVSYNGDTYPLPDPFMVIATKNPIEYEGTYVLPEAQLDRFMFKIAIGYPSLENEVALLLLNGNGKVGAHEVSPVIAQGELTMARARVKEIYVPEAVAKFTAAIVRKTRELPDIIYGASPRAAVHLLCAAQAAAYMDDRDTVSAVDVASMAVPVLRHRITLEPEAQLEGKSPEDYVKAAVAASDMVR
jgi:MoxR-like ATPase